MGIYIFDNTLCENVCQCCWTNLLLIETSFGFSAVTSAHGNDTFLALTTHDLPLILYSTVSGWYLLFCGLTLRICTGDLAISFSLTDSRFSGLKQTTHVLSTRY